MTTIRQHIPAYIDGIEKETATFNSLEEISEIPFIKRIWMDDNFERFSVCSHEHGRSNLMVEQKNDDFWVVGYLSDRPDYLPEWEEESEVARWLAKKDKRIK